MGARVTEGADAAGLETGEGGGIGLGNPKSPDGVGRGSSNRCEAENAEGGIKV